MSEKNSSAKEGVAVHHHPLPQALGPGGADAVQAQRLTHGGPGVPRARKQVRGRDVMSEKNSSAKKGFAPLRWVSRMFRGSYSEIKY